MQSAVTHPLPTGIYSVVYLYPSHIYLYFPQQIITPSRVASLVHRPGANEWQPHSKHRGNAPEKLGLRIFQQFIIWEISFALCRLGTPVIIHLSCIVFYSIVLYCIM